MSRHPTPALKSGAVVRMTWGGGNGPHLYVVEVIDGCIYARVPAELVRYGADDPLRTYNPIARVGDEFTLHSIEVLQP